MRRPAVIACVLALVSCTGHPNAAPRVGGRHLSPSPSPLRVGRSSPPAVRMFAGTASIIGTPLRYCAGGSCVSRAASAPRLTVPAGSLVTFAVGRAPQSALVEVGGAGGGHFALGPATLMALDERLAPGAHVLTLTLRWADGEGTWAFRVAASG